MYKKEGSHYEPSFFENLKVSETIQIKFITLFLVLIMSNRTVQSIMIKKIDTKSYWNN